MRVNNENKNQSEKSSEKLSGEWPSVQIGSGFLTMVPLAQHGSIVIYGDCLYLYDSYEGIIQSASIVDCDVYANFWTILTLGQVVMLRMPDRTYSLGNMDPEFSSKINLLSFNYIGQIKNMRMFRSEFKRLKAKAISNQ